MCNHRVAKPRNALLKNAPCSGFKAVELQSNCCNTRRRSSPVRLVNPTPSASLDFYAYENNESMKETENSHLLRVPKFELDAQPCHFSHNEGVLASQT